MKKIDNQIDCHVTPELVLAIGSKYGAIDVPHTHPDEYQIEVPLLGTFHDLSRKAAAQFVPGTANVFNPDEPHRTHYENSNSYFFSVSRQKMAQALDALGCPGGAEVAFDPNRPYRIQTKLQTQQTLSTHALQLHAQCTESGNDSLMEMIVKENAESFFNATLQSLLTQISWTNVSEKIGYHHSLINRSQKWISDHVADDSLSLEKIAAAARMSPYHFSRVFKHRTGISPIAWLSRKRTEHAVKIALSHRITLEDAALKSGFRSAKQLNYHLRRHPDLFQKLTNGRSLREIHTLRF